jgi:cytidylate kinase
MSMPQVIAIDGPAASGKSSTAAAVAARLGWPHIDSGALYRAVTWIAVQSRLESPDRIVAETARRGLDLAAGHPTMVVTLDGRLVGDAIRSAEVTAAVSRVSAMPEVRALVDRIMHETVQRLGTAVVDGRDIGTVVFPDADCKVYLDARPEVRARRRLAQRGREVKPDELVEETALLAERDRRDSTRGVAPLRPAADAQVLDTSDLTFEEQVARIVALAGRGPTALPPG